MQLDVLILKTSIENVIRLCTLALKTKEMGPKATAQTYLNRGAAFASEQRYGLALRDYDNAILYDPTLFEINANRGSVLLALNRPREALDAYNASLSRRPDDRPSLVGRGGVLLQLGNAEAAKIDFEHALRMNENDPSGWFNLGIANYQMGRMGDADVAFTRVIERSSGDAEAYFNRARARLYGYEEGALDDFRRALEINPDFTSVYIIRGKYFDSVQNRDAANQDFRRAYDLGWSEEWLHERILSMQ